MARWRYPSLSLHGIEGAFSEPGAKTVIPRKVIGKFSIRIVPNQTPESVNKLTCDYLNKKWAERGSPNFMKVSFILRGSTGGGNTYLKFIVIYPLTQIGNTWMGIPPLLITVRVRILTLSLLLYFYQISAVCNLLLRQEAEYQKLK